MSPTRVFVRGSLSLPFLIISLSFAAAARGQTPVQKDAGQQEEVVRVETELVQTDVSVVDKRGQFVEGLRAEEFELRVDGRPQAVAFFESVTAGAADEESKLRAARGRKGAAADVAATAGAAAPAPTRGRVIFFFVDDVHLAPDSLARARKALRDFVDERLGADDLAAVVSTSGQVGFLQQLTDNKAVLREAIERLVNKRNTEPYAGKVPISESDANRIANHRDRELFAYLVEATRNEYQIGYMAAAQMVRNRVRQIDAQSRPVEQATLLALEGLMRSSAPLPGRKLVLFISDGFIVDVRKSNAPVLLQRVTQEAARVGAVVYTVDPRGLFHDPAVDAGRNDYPDFSQRVTGRNFFETKAVQEPLMTLAAETGGRAFINTNSLEDAFAQAAREASRYYLLAWRPDTETQRAGRSRVEVFVRGRPDLRVQARRRFVAANAPAAATRPAAGPKGGAAPKAAEEELRDALASLYPRRELPLALSVGFLNRPGEGAVLVASMQLDGEAVGFGPGAAGREEAQVDVQGVAIDDRGRFNSFRQLLTVPRAGLGEGRQRFVNWSQQLPLAPGLYQVRVAARDRRTGRAGSQSQWLEIPAPSPSAVSMSSIFLGELRAGEGGARRSVAVNVGRRFARRSRLRFQTYVDAPPGVSTEALPLEVKVLGGGRAVLTLPPGRPAPAPGGDPRRLAFSGEFDLGRLPAGRYVLQISAADPGTKSTVVREATFVVE